MDHRVGDPSFIDRSAKVVAAERLKEIQALSDKEIAHSLADDVLCELLIKLGYAVVVEEWKRVEKWYS